MSEKHILDGRLLFSAAKHWDDVVLGGRQTKHLRPVKNNQRNQIKFNALRSKTPGVRLPARWATVQIHLGDYAVNQGFGNYFRVADARPTQFVRERRLTLSEREANSLHIGGCLMRVAERCLSRRDLFKSLGA